MADAGVLDIAEREERLLVTCDEDFGELVYRQRRASAGVLLIRPGALDLEAATELVCRLLDQHQPQLAGALGVVTPDAIRFQLGLEPPAGWVFKVSCVL